MKGNIERGLSRWGEDRIQNRKLESSSRTYSTVSREWRMEKKKDIGGSQTPEFSLCFENCSIPANEH